MEDEINKQRRGGKTFFYYIEKLCGGGTKSWKTISKTHRLLDR